MCVCIMCLCVLCVYLYICISVCLYVCMSVLYLAIPREALLMNAPGLGFPPRRRCHSQESAPRAQLCTQHAAPPAVSVSVCVCPNKTPQSLNTQQPPPSPPIPSTFPPSCPRRCASLRTAPWLRVCTLSPVSSGCLPAWPRRPR